MPTEKPTSRAEKSLVITLKHLSQLGQLFKSMCDQETEIKKDILDSLRDNYRTNLARANEQYNQLDVGANREPLRLMIEKHKEIAAKLPVIDRLHTDPASSKLDKVSTIISLTISYLRTISGKVSMFNRTDKRDISHALKQLDKLQTQLKDNSNNFTLCEESLTHYLSKLEGSLVLGALILNNSNRINLKTLREERKVQYNDVLDLIQEAQSQSRALSQPRSEPAQAPIEHAERISQRFKQEVHPEPVQARSESDKDTPTP